MIRAAGKLKFVVRAIPLIAFLAIGTAALCYSTEAWASAVISVSALAPLAVTLGAVFGNRERLPFRCGFAICFGSYFLLWFFAGNSTVQIMSGPPGALPSFQTLATTKVIVFLHDKVFFRDAAQRLLPNPNSNYGGGFGGGAFDTKPEDTQDPFTTDSKNAAANDPSATPATQPGLTLPAAMFATFEDAEVAENFQKIGQCLWAWIFGWVGGYSAQFLARRRSANQAAASKC